MHFLLVQKCRRHNTIYVGDVFTEREREMEPSGNSLVVKTSPLQGRSLGFKSWLFDYLGSAKPINIGMYFLDPQYISRVPFPSPLCIERWTDFLFSWSLSLPGCCLELLNRVSFLQGAMNCKKNCMYPLDNCSFILQIIQKKNTTMEITNSRKEGKRIPYIKPNHPPIAQRKKNTFVPKH